MQPALMEISDLEAVPTTLKVVWSSVTMECGVQCVMTSGAYLMLLWCAGSWDTVQLVCSTIKL